MSRRVVITGMGAVTPLGDSVVSTWKGLSEGRSGIGPITLFDASEFPTRIAGQVREFVPDARMGRHSQFALQAAREAVSDARLSRGAAALERTGIYFGAGDGGFNFHEYAAVIGASMNGGDCVRPDVYFDLCSKRLDARSWVEQDPCQVVNHLAAEFGTLGPVYNSLTACAASSQAIGEAMKLIQDGEVDVMITGGAHSMIHPLGLAGFNLLTALSTRNDEPESASRPFDKERDGFVLSEGAGALVLEDLEHARARGAKVLAELAGYGTTADAFRLTDPHPEGRGAIRAMRLALEDARMGPADIGYINAHGTSTELNDQIETRAVKEVFGATAKSVPMSSIKSMLGHMIAAAGAVELIASILTIREGLLPPTINYRTPDETCDLDYVPNAARKKKVSAVLSNSFGFGGQNVALIVKEYRA